MKKFVFLLILFVPFVSLAQFTTLKLKPGQTYSNETKDTLVVTSLEKIQSAVIKSRELKIALKEIDVSNELIKNLKEQNKALEEKADAQNKIIESYKTQIEGSEIHANNMKKEAKRQKRQKLMALGGGAVLVVISILLL